MAADSPPPVAHRKWPKRLAIAGWSLLSLLGAVLAAFVLTVTFGAVHGTEFCPQTFERRSYSYYELPLVGIQVTGEKHEDLTGDTEACITSNKFITPPPGGKKEWHVLVGSRRRAGPGMLIFCSNISTPPTATTITAGCSGRTTISRWPKSSGRPFSNWPCMTCMCMCPTCLIWRKPLTTPES